MILTPGVVKRNWGKRRIRLYSVREQQPDKEHSNPSDGSTTLRLNEGARGRREWEMGRMGDGTT